MLKRGLLSVSIVAAICLLCTVRAFTVKDELRALRRGVEHYVALHGLRLDRIEVETPDGWILEVHRVRSMDIFNEKLSPPVLMAHGVSCSSMEFMVNRRNESLAFLLADRGYDSWMINFRTNKFSHKVRRNGKVVRPSARDFYRGSFQDMAEKDLPAVIRKIQEVTGQKKVYLIGYSMGVLVMFAFMSEFHQYDDMVPELVTISPGIFGKDTIPYAKAFVEIAPYLVRRFTFGPVFEALMSINLIVTPSDRINSVVEYVFGESCRLNNRICSRLVNIFFQRGLLNAFIRDDPHVKTERLPIMFTKNPAGSMLLNGYLIGQLTIDRPWTKLDYDKFPQMKISNQAEYNQPKPPAYNLTDIRVPFSLYITRDDKFSGPDTAKKIFERFNPTYQKYVKEKQLSHIGAIWGWDARCSIYDEVIDRFDRFELRRAGLNGTGSLDDATDKARAKYRLSTVPEFVQKLPFERTCPEDDE